jgi:hypothetical protein
MMCFKKNLPRYTSTQGYIGKYPPPPGEEITANVIQGKKKYENGGEKRGKCERERRKNKKRGKQS